MNQGVTLRFMNQGVTKMAVDEQHNSPNELIILGVEKNLMIGFTSYLYNIKFLIIFYPFYKGST